MAKKWSSKDQKFVYTKFVKNYFIEQKVMQYVHNFGRNFANNIKSPWVKTASDKKCAKKVLAAVFLNAHAWYYF